MSGEPVTRRFVGEAIDLLLDDGPALGRPLADRISGSRLHNLKELRPGSSGTTEVRILFIFDPARKAVLLIAGDKSGQWEQWYRDPIPAAETAYQAYLRGNRMAMSQEPDFFTYTREEFLDEFVHPDVGASNKQMVAIRVKREDLAGLNPMAAPADWAAG